MSSAGLATSLKPETRPMRILSCCRDRLFLSLLPNSLNLTGCPSRKISTSLPRSLSCRSTAPHLTEESQGSAVARHVACASPRSCECKRAHFTLIAQIPALYGAVRRLLKKVPRRDDSKRLASHSISKLSSDLAQRRRNPISLYSHMLTRAYRLTVALTGTLGNCFSA